MDTYDLVMSPTYLYLIMQRDGPIEERKYTWSWETMDSTVVFGKGAGMIINDGDVFNISEDTTVLYWGKVYQKSSTSYHCYVNGTDNVFKITINRLPLEKLTEARNGRLEEWKRIKDERVELERIEDVQQPTEKL